MGQIRLGAVAARNLLVSSCALFWGLPPNWAAGWAALIFCAPPEASN